MSGGSNKFSEQVKKGKGGQKKGVKLTDLLADSGADELVSRAKADGRFISLAADSFVPDPNQPRKTFEQERIDELRMSIEGRGQLQPILVGEKLPDGTYPIIAGERRWRAIRESKSVLMVDAVVRSNDSDELALLLMQIDENNQREQIPAVENAMAMKRVVDLCKAAGKGQADAAELMGVSPGQISKHLALLGAPSVVTGLSVHGETQDVEVLYSLAKAAESKPEEVAELIDQWRSGELDQNLRKASQDLATEAKQEKKEAKSKGQGSLKTDEKEEKPGGGAAKPKKASAVRLDQNDGEFVITVEFGNKTLSFKVDAETVVSLKSDIAKNWN